MTPLRVFVSRLLDLFLRGRRDRQLSDEIQAHLDCLADEYASRGLSRPEAETAARWAFGGVERIKDSCRDQRSLPLVDGLWCDLRQASRLLSRDRSFTLLTVITLALGVSVSNAAFTIVDAICLRGLPIERPERVLYLSTADRHERSAGLSYRDFTDVGRTSASFDGLAAFSSAPATLGDDGQAPDRVAGTYISAGAFRLLGEAPALGREFLPADDRPGAPAVSILGSAVWRSRYGGDAAVIGRTIRVNGVPSVVVGVMPDGFRFPANADLWQPLGASPGLEGEGREARGLSVFGRLGARITVADAQGELAAIGFRLAGGRPDTNRDVRILGVPINEQFNGRITDRVWLAFLTAGALVLLIACANAANLLLMRGASRSREVAIRVSIGASRGRIVRQLLVESALIAAMAGMLGLAGSRAAVRLLAWSVPSASPLPYWIAFTIDARVLAALIVTCVSSVMICGVTPALHVSRVRPNEVLKEGGRPGRAGVRGRRWTAGFLAVEFALSVVLLAPVGLGVRQFRRVQQTETPVDASRLLAAWLTLPERPYGTPDERWRLYEQLLGRLDTVGGIASSTIASSLPYAGAAPAQLAIEGRARPSGEAAPIVQTVTVGARYFETLGLPMQRGRAFAGADGTPGHGAAIVNQRFADRYFGSQDAVGRRIQVRAPAASSQASSSSPWLTIVGVSPTVRQRPAPVPDPIVYLRDRAAPPSSAVLIVRAASGDPGALASRVRDEMRRVDPGLPLYRVMPMERSLHEAGWNGRVSAIMLYTISTIALLLSLVGLYAVTAHAAAERTREIGVRVALGATAPGIAWLVLRRALGHLGLGLAAGVACCWAFRGLFDDPASPERATDPVGLVSILVLISLVATAACLSPALHAARTDPTTALRCE